MIYLSELLGRTIRDTQQRPIGRLGDLILAGSSPAVVAIVVQTPTRGRLSLAWEPLSRQADQTLLRPTANDWPLYTPSQTPSEDDIWLARDLLDKEVVDTTHAKLVRVNAVLLEMSSQAWRLYGVEIGLRGLLYRLGLGWLANRLALSPRVLSWEEISLPRGRGAHRRLQQLHPAEIAAIVHELPPAEASDLVESLPDDVAADALEEIHPDRQADLLDDMAPERAADILGEMAPDEAADILQDLPDQKAEELLRLMDKDEAADVTELLVHREGSAGGIMTTDYATLRPDLTAADSLAELRQRFAGELDDVHYIYVTDVHERLLGVLSLWDLVVASPQARLADCMEQKVIRVRADQDATEAARLMARYNLLAIPVVDEQERLLGIVTVDDAMDLILPESWRQQLPRMY